MRRSGVRVGIEGNPRATHPSRPRLGILDLLLVVGLLGVMGSRTPAGGLGWYVVERLRGHTSELPSLTAYFDSGAAAPALVDALPVLPPLHDDTSALAEGAFPEPWRTAARAALADPPAPVQARLSEVGGDDPLMTWLDAHWQATGDPEAALEVLAIGESLRERAIARAQAAGEPDPHRYEAHRRYLPGNAQRDADRVVKGALGLATVLDLEWPVRHPHRVSSPWGDRIHPVLRTKRFHNGVDLAVPVGTPVHVAQAGTVVVLGEDARSGKYVIVDHGNGVRTAYCHLSAIRVPQGEPVDQGQLLGLSGNTGRSTGPHLHYVVRIAGQTVNPERFRRDPLDVAASRSPAPL